MTIQTVDAVVVGAGPAGASAAIELARAGASVVVLDENARPGGQIYRQPPAEFTIDRPGADAMRGRALLARFSELPIRFVGGACVWGCFETKTLEVASGEEVWRLHAEVIVVAAGAYDRPAPLPGWSLPGVMTVGGAQTLVKAQGVLPGHRVLLAGTGPLLLVVASQLAKAGAEIVAVAEAVSSKALLPHVGALLRAWPLIRDGIGYRYTLMKARVPWLAPYVITRMEGTAQVERAVLARVDDAWRTLPGTERAFDVDTVCLGYGLVPSVELLQLLGCQLQYDERADVFLPIRSATCETSVPGVFAVGDGAGVAGVKVAVEEGCVAGIAAARLLGRLSDSHAERASAGPRQRLARLRPFRAAMDEVYRPRPGLYDLVTPDTLVCRCEEVTRAQIAAAIDDGAATMTQVKAWNRCGMGACQARMCAIPTMHVVARALGKTASELGAYPPGPLAKPVSVAALIRELAGVDAGSISGQGVTHPLDHAETARTVSP